MGLFAPFSSGLSSNDLFIQIQSLLRCNATLSDIEKFYNDNLDKDFIDFCVTFYLAESQFNIHQNDAIQIEQMQRQEEANKKTK